MNTLKRLEELLEVLRLLNVTCDEAVRYVVGENWAEVISDEVQTHLNLAMERASDAIEIVHHLEDVVKSHPRAFRLMEKEKYFIVIAHDEPYFIAAYNLIRQREMQMGRWTDEDELIYRLWKGD